MTNCCLAMFRGLWSFLMGSLRMILFFMCLLYIIVQAIFLVGLFNVDKSAGLVDLPGARVRFHDYLHVFCLLLLGLLGAYGTFYKHHPSIRAFSLLSALNTLLLTLILLYTMGPEDVRQQHNELFAKLKDYMSDYSWDHNGQFDSTKRELATNTWDNLQQLMCCGIKGPENWADFRPSGLSKDTYPPSCCLHKDKSRDMTSLCTKQDSLFETGCSDRVSQIEVVSFISMCVLIIYQLALSVISYMVGNCTSESRHHPRQAMGMSVPRTQTIYVAQPYQQQPPINQDFVDHPPSAKHSLPPMYPNLHGNTTVPNYSAPPPSYGT